MNNVSLMLADGISHVSVVQDALDGVLSLVGNTTDEAIGKSQALSTLQKDGPAGLALLQQQQGLAAHNSSGNATNVTQLMATLTPAIMSAVHNVLTSITDKVSKTLARLLVKIKPALEQVGRWIVRFGDKIQAGIEVFSATLDKVQKIFDQVMAQLHGKGDNEEVMLDQTFNLFDTTNDGYISIEDLREVADLYSMTALQGELAERLVAKYDVTGDMKLGKQEMLQLVNDPAIPNSMPTLLRTYARRLSEVGGNVAAARQRDEVAYAVVQYLQVVCAKNMTKVGWIADRLGNHSLPQEFTADVMVQLCMLEDDPNKLTSASVGALIIGEMYKMHPRNTLVTLDILSNTSFWAAEGFDVQDQPSCIKQLTSWVTSAQGAAVPKTEEATPNASAPASFVQLLGVLGSGQAAMDHKTLQALPDAAKRLTEESVALFMLDQKQQEKVRHKALFHSETSQMLLDRLLGGVSVSTATRGTSFAEAAKRGRAARAETLEFASWLAINATSTAKERQEMCFDYSSESSSAMDGFATQIQGMVSQMQGFIDMMEKYATPAGIEQLDTTVQDFVGHGMKDVMVIVEKRINSVLNTSSPELERSIHNAAHVAGEKLGRELGKALGSPIGEAMIPTVRSVVGEITNQSEAAQDLISEELGKELGNAVANLTSEAIAKSAGDMVEELVDQALVKGDAAAEALLKRVSDQFAPPASLLQAKALSGLYHTETSRRLHDQVEAFHSRDFRTRTSLEADFRAEFPGEDVADALSGAWTQMVGLLRNLIDTLPTAISTLKFAKREVSKLSSNLDSVFETFEVKGPALFEKIAGIYRTIWMIYFLVLLPLNLVVLYYAFWASGYFGGPMPVQDEDDMPAPASFRERCGMCLSSCTVCFQKHHDTAMVFWSVIVLFQIVVLVIFLAAIALCILAGVKAFILAGCDEVYVLADETICTETLDNLRSFMDTFFVSDASAPLTAACQRDHLLTCGLIKQKMVTSTILTTVFSLGAAIFSMQLVIDSAVLHEQARWRRLAHALYLKEAAGGPSSSSGAAGSEDAARSSS